MNHGLLLTLGHNSSAIFIRKGEVINGYQTERVTKVKSDGSFPARAIEEIEKWDPVPFGTPIFVSHWHPSGLVDRMTAKHWNRAYLESKYPGSEIIFTGQQFSHHDAHAYSALAYNPTMPEGSHILVADGFGHWGEVFSAYIKSGDKLVLVKRVFGYTCSLGLMYQYATDYVGLKMNQDEWKLNAMANEVSATVVDNIRVIAIRFAIEMVERQVLSEPCGPDDPIINIGALSYAHAFFISFLQKHFHPSSKAEIAFFLQTTVEHVMTHWIDCLSIKDVTLVGGCFLNVQLNGYIASNVEGSTCACPLSGDEGAALGLYKIYNPEFVIPHDLCWGQRRLRAKDFVDVPGIVPVHSALKTAVSQALRQNKIVNVVRGAMEYGPRAYCNTSTLARPTELNRRYINLLNDRDQCMPMCPVVDESTGRDLFAPTHKVPRSLFHMAMALPYTVFTPDIKGVAHPQVDGQLTGRPQFVTEIHWMHDICKEFGPLINTSFNNHGSPICLSARDVIRTHLAMKENDRDNRVITFVEVESNLDDSEM